MSNVKNLGIVSPVPKDEWDSSVSYNILNIVSHKGMVFIAKDSSIGIEPFVDPQWKQYWMYLLTSGTSATNLLTTDDIADNLITDDAQKVLSAKQGKILNDTKVGLTGDEEIGGQKTFTEDIETKDRFVVLNKGATDLISGLAGMAIKTGATGLLFKGQWEFANKPTYSDHFTVRFSRNTFCTVKPNKGVCLYDMSVSIDGGNKERVVSVVNNERFSNAINPNGTETAGTIYVLSHTKNSSTYDFNGETLTLSQLWDKYGISLFNNSGAFDITFIYLYGTGSFYLKDTGLSKEWNFGTGTVTVNGTDYTFSMYILQGKDAFGGSYWLPNVTYNFGDDFNAAVSVDNYGTVTKEMWEQFLYVFEPHTSYQTQTTPTAYSVAYDTATDSLKIGYGYYNTAGEYILYDELSDSITTRADSTELTDGHILKWDSIKNRLVDSGKNPDDITTVTASNEGTATETIKYITINGVEKKLDYDPVIIEEEHTVSDWTALANSQPFFYSTTVTITQPLQEKTYVSLKNDDPVFFANFGLVIASIEGQTATIYATNLPADNTKITFILEN